METLAKVLLVLCGVFLLIGVIYLTFFCIKGCQQAPFLFFNTKISENIIKYK